MSFSPEKLEQIKASTETYKREVETINTLIFEESDDNRLDMLYHLRALSTIQHCGRIGLLDSEDLDESYTEALGREVSRYFPHKDDAELFDDLAILDDDVKDRYFENPQSAKQSLLDALKITL
jgi:hypothetical protein